jgi:hypothetical protein
MLLLLEGLGSNLDLAAEQASSFSRTRSAWEPEQGTPLVHWQRYLAATQPSMAVGID